MKSSRPLPSAKTPQGHGAASLQRPSKQGRSKPWTVSQSFTETNNQTQT